MLKSVLIALLLLAAVACTQKKEKILPVVSDITASVYSSVTIQPDSLYQVFSIVSGILDKNLVEEGDLVKKGTTLLEIISVSPKLNTENALLSLQLAQKNFNGNAAILNSIRDEIDAATLKMANDSVNYYRQRNLWKQQIGSKVEYEAKKLSYELSSNSIKLLKRKYKRTKDELETQLEQARNNYKTSQITTEDFTVNSKINGKVYALYKNTGELVNTIDPIASIGSAAVFVVKMLVDEVDIIKIKKNQQVLITLDAYKGEVFTAKVNKIYPKKEERNQTFVVEALFDQQPEVLYPGLSGEANIIIANRKQVLTLPKQYLISDNKVNTENGIQEITIGLESMDTVEIRSGITSKTWIYKPKE